MFFGLGLGERVKGLGMLLAAVAIPQGNGAGKKKD